MRSDGGSGLNWFTRARSSAATALKLDWKLIKDDNGGILVGFPNPGTDRDIAINQGYEIQIDESDVLGPPDRLDLHLPGRGPRQGRRRPSSRWASGTRTRSRSRARTSRCSSTASLGERLHEHHPPRDLTQGFIGIQNHGAGEHRLVPQHPAQGGSGDAGGADDGRGRG